MPTFDVRDFGARGNRRANDRDAIQAAVDACAEESGGTVRLTKGDYLSGTIRLRSGVTLRLDAGATLRAIDGRAHYEGDEKLGHLLVADDAERIAVVGQGVLRGTGRADYGPRSPNWKKLTFRTGIALFTRCRDVAIRGVRIFYSDAWTLHFKRCEDVTIDSVTIRNNPRRLNSDGIDPNMCRRVRITNCRITAGDDCIVVKATERHPCEDVEVRGCVLESTTAGIKFGTESFGDFRDIRVADCTIRSPLVGLGFYLKDGGTMQRIAISNLRITMPTTRNCRAAPIFMDIERRYSASKVGRIRRVTIEDVDVRAGVGSVIQGMPDRPIENLTLRRIALRVQRPVDYSQRIKPKGAMRCTNYKSDNRYVRLPAYLTLAHIRGLTLDGVRVEMTRKALREFPRSAVCLRDVCGGSIRIVSRIPASGPGAPPVVDAK